VVKTLRVFELMVLADILVPSETNNLTKKSLPQSTSPASLKSFCQIFVFTLKPLGAW